MVFNTIVFNTIVFNTIGLITEPSRHIQNTYLKDMFSVLIYLLLPHGMFFDIVEEPLLGFCRSIFGPA